MTEPPPSPLSPNQVRIPFLNAFRIVFAAGLLIEIALVGYFLSSLIGPSHLGVGSAWFFVLTQLPYCVSLTLVAITSRPRWNAIAGGIATAVSFAGEIGVGLMVAFFTFFYGWEAKDNPTPYHALLMLLVMNPFIIVFAYQLGKCDGKVYLMSLIGTLIYVFIGYALSWTALQSKRDKPASAEWKGGPALMRISDQRIALYDFTGEDVEFPGVYPTL